MLRIPAGEVLDGTLPRLKMELAQAWVEIHAEELKASWALAAAGELVFKIAPSVDGGPQNYSRSLSR